MITHLLSSLTDMFDNLLSFNCHPLFSYSRHSVLSDFRLFAKPKGEIFTEIDNQNYNISDQ